MQDEKDSFIQDEIQPTLGQIEYPKKEINPCEKSV